MKKSETKKYIAVIDPVATVKSGFIYKALAAKDIIEAMNEAIKYMADDTYLISIFEKQPGGDTEKVEYAKILTNRGSGWRTNEDGEHEASFDFYYKWHNGISPIKAPDIEWYI